ncbi:MAG: malectin domain-containing carbohydrate-binding protein, partial [Acidobacteriaceae bacterium]|nr:malectin domain-containing carbohydrate-binding protein [Acidobacteriaceae bacterium]
QIKEYSIGVECFDRGAAFDQETNSVVRVQANRLRHRLAEYYAEEGATHPLRITIPLGQYVPRFEPATAATVASPPNLPQDTAVLPPIRPRKITGLWLAAALILLALGLWNAVFMLHRARQAAIPDTSSATLNPEAQFGPPNGDEVRILAGTTRSLVDHAGRLWSADTDFDGGSIVKSAVQHIWRTQEQGFYRTSRQGQFRYNIPLKAGLYELHLHFAETVYDPESSGTSGEGSRIFSVRANGRTLLDHFDIVADAGASRTADVKVFPGLSPDKDGLLHLEFTGEDGKQAILSGIEILPGVKGHIRPVRVLTRQIPYYSNDSNWWSPDNFFQGGQLASYTAPVSGTDDPELYESERWGNFTYAIPIAPGKYAVLLHFAVRHGAWDQPDPAASDKDKVAHVFNVFCNGKLLLNHFDLEKEGHDSDVVVRKATGLEANAQGKLLLAFVPVQGYATVTGIEVIPE